MSLTSGYKSKQTFVGVGEAKRAIESSYGTIYRKKLAVEDDIRVIGADVILLAAGKE